MALPWQLFLFFNSLLTFLLALYVSRAVERWWEMRVRCIGGLWDAIDSLCMWAAAWWSRGSSQDTAARALVLRYGLLSHALLFKAARGELREAENPNEAGLEDLVSQKLLKHHEAVALAPLPCKSNVVWAWQTTFWSQALSMRHPSLRANEQQPAQPTVTVVPHSEFLLPMVMAHCGKARDSISAGLTYVATQQPFAYTHLLALSVWVAIFLNALLSGLKLAYVGPKTESSGFVWPRPESWPLYLACSARLVIVPVMYDGLLAMGAQLENPFLTDHGFPADLYEHDIHAGCLAMAKGVDAIAASWWESTGVQISAQLSAEDAKAPRPDGSPIRRQGSETAFEFGPRAAGKGLVPITEQPRAVCTRNRKHGQDGLSRSTSRVCSRAGSRAGSRGGSKELGPLGFIPNVAPKSSALTRGQSSRRVLPLVHRTPCAPELDNAIGAASAGSSSPLCSCHALHGGVAE